MIRVMLQRPWFWLIPLGLLPHIIGIEAEQLRALALFALHEYDQAAAAEPTATPSCWNANWWPRANRWP